MDTYFSGLADHTTSRGHVTCSLMCFRFRVWNVRAFKNLLDAVDIRQSFAISIISARHGTAQDKRLDVLLVLLSYV